MKTISLLSTLATFLVIPGFVHGQVLNFTATSDGSTTSAGGSYSNVNNEGALEVGNVGGNSRDTVVGFTPSGLSGGTITGASITFTINGGENGSASTVETDLYQLVPANDLFTAAADYNTQDGTNPWAGGPTGGSAAGTDYINTLLAQNTIPASPATGSTFTLALNAAGIAALQSIVNAGSTADFVVLNDPSTTGGNEHFAPSGTGAPVLTVDYSAGPEPSTWAMLLMGSVSFLGLRRFFSRTA